MNSRVGSSISLTSPTPTTDYERLPACIRRLYTPKEYAWLSDGQKAQLTRAELEPEWDE